MGEEAKAIDVADAENGPVTEANRQCRDMFCCLLFLAAIAGMVYLTIYGYTQGNPSYIYRGVDQNGVQCGYPGGPAELFPYLYFVNPTVEISKRLCVSSCPAFNSGTLSALTCYNTACAYTKTVSQSGTPSGTFVAGDIVGYEATAVVNRVCVPSTSVFTSFQAVASSASTTFASVLQQGDLSSFISDIANNWQWLLAAFGFAVIVSFIFMFALRCLAGLIVWLSLIGIIFTLAGLGVIFLYNGGFLNNSTTSAAAVYLGVPSFASTSEYNNVIGWVLIGIAAFFLLVVFCCCSRIRLAVAVCKCAGQFVASVCTVVLVPIVQTLIAIILWAGCLVIMIYLVSASTFTSDSTLYFSSIANYGDPNLIRFYCFIFGTLWCNAFIQAMAIFVIASATCMWYYSHGPGQQLSLPILRSYKMIFRYHFGSLAFGSLILAIVQFLQFLLQVFKKQAESSGAAQNPCFAYVMTCLQCCLACVERIVEFLNKTAYIQIALRGKSFCNAAKDGFDIVWSNAMRFAIVNTVGEIIMFLGKLMIASLTAVGFYVLITYVPQIKATYMAPVYSIIIVFIMAYAVSIFFMAVYTLAMDALLQCFIVDEMNQKGKGGKGALHAPSDLADLIERD